MRTEIYQWIKNLAFFHVLTTAVLHILPDKRYEQHIRLFMGLDDFRKLFEKAEASDFLKGANKRNWSATFDWMICDSNMAKVLDGNYDPKDQGGMNDEPEPTNSVQLW